MAKKKVRTYNRDNREKLSLENKDRILDLAIKLIIEHKDQFSIRKLAKDAKFSERHLYRLFGGLEGLATEFNEKMNSHMGLGAGIPKLSLDNLPAYAQELFKTFNNHHDLVASYLASPLGSAARVVWIKEKHKRISESFKDHTQRDLLSKEVTLILSAKFWNLARIEAGMSGEEAVRHVVSIAEQIVEKYKKG